MLANQRMEELWYRSNRPSRFRAYGKLLLPTISHFYFHTVHLSLSLSLSNRLKENTRKRLRHKEIEIGRRKILYLGSSGYRYCCLSFIRMKVVTRAPLAEKGPRQMRRIHLTNLFLLGC